MENNSSHEGQLVPFVCCGIDWNKTKTTPSAEDSAYFYHMEHCPVCGKKRLSAEDFAQQVELANRLMDEILEEEDSDLAILQAAERN